MHMRRTVTRDTTFAGVQMQKSQKIAMWYISANRDERYFPDPYRFDMACTPNEQGAFGTGGAHFCLGAHLARREVTAMFVELFGRLPDIRAPPRRLPSAEEEASIASRAVGGHSADRALRMPADPALLHAGSGRGSSARPVVTSSIRTERSETSTHRRPLRVALVAALSQQPARGFNRQTPEPSTGSGGSAHTGIDRHRRQENVMETADSRNREVALNLPRSPGD